MMTIRPGEDETSRGGGEGGRETSAAGPSRDRVLAAMPCIASRREYEDRRKYLSDGRPLSEGPAADHGADEPARLPGDKWKHALICWTSTRRTPPLKVLEALPKPWDTEVSFARAMPPTGDTPRRSPAEGVPLTRGTAEGTVLPAYGQYRRKKHRGPEL